MLAITRLVVVSVLSKRKEVDVDDIKDIVIRKIPVLAGVIANESPYEVEEEIDLAISEINIYAEYVKKKSGIEKCVEMTDRKIKVNDNCSEVVKELYEEMKRQIESGDSLLADYGRLVLPILE